MCQSFLLDEIFLEMNPKLEKQVKLNMSTQINCRLMAKR